MTAHLRTALVVLLLGEVLAGCAPASSPQVSAAQAAACRKRADEVFDRQNRGDLYRSDTHAGGTRDAAFSSTGAPGRDVAQLSSRFARDRMYSDCLRSVAGNIGTAPEAPPPTDTTARPGGAPGGVTPGVAAPATARPSAGRPLGVALPPPAP